MTTMQLAIRLMRHAQIKDLANLPLDDATTLLDGINAAISEYYDLAPDYYSRTTISTLLPAPSIISVPAVNGSNQFGSDVFTEEQRGATVTIGDDPGFNEIASLDTVLDAYRGTTGTQNATVYGDAVALLNTEFKRVSGHPRLDNGIQLDRDDNIRERRWRGNRSTGMPRCYSVEPIGGAQGGKETVILRVDPMPSQEFTLRMEVILTSLRMVYEDLVTPRDLPIPAYMIEGSFIPLCIYYLQGTTFWAGDKKTDERAQLARTHIAQMAQSIARPKSRVLTPRGW